MATALSALRYAIRSRTINLHYTALLKSSQYRAFHVSRRVDVVKPFLLADIGEGITECQLIQWFVQPGARVEQFDKLCEVQSDKASVEITSPFDGVIKKLYYDPDDMAITGKPLVDIDIQSEISEEDEAKLAGGEGEASPADEGEAKMSSGQQEMEAQGGAEAGMAEAKEVKSDTPRLAARRPTSKSDHGTLATPAVRHLTKELDVNIGDVEGTGRDGRVLKEDVHRHVSLKSQKPETPEPSAKAPKTREDKRAPLTPVQSGMFKLMTRSLNIPHFLYTCAADVSALTALRKKLSGANKSTEQKLTHLPFIIKAVSLALQQHPLLNASLDTKDPKKPELVYKGAHNFGFGADTPHGLMVPVIRNVQDLSIVEIAVQLRELSEKARNNKLAPFDLRDATFTISNIGSVGGGVVAPVISEPQVAIVGIGRSKVVPAFDENEELVRKEELTLSWSADHRVVDGAECARCAERVRSMIEDPASMMVNMR
ncbi:hypothetical protein LTR62_000472 [Meristemomyces frigidus]|uniref:Dihydrolipoamide acetyltransferase component of pyruvate dehydrogenase complex n=1 Tax=Meristemomyces frigidus TaxID=1508187 RepID=A0AAN7TGZ5_9PEZI|nr:hypothetical protein LTR62_000472 [Meristemomyces frigidus]